MSARVRGRRGEHRAIAQTSRARKRTSILQLDLKGRRELRDGARRDEARAAGRHKETGDENKGRARPKHHRRVRRAVQIVDGEARDGPEKDERRAHIGRVHRVPVRGQVVQIGTEPRGAAHGEHGAHEGDAEARNDEKSCSPMSVAAACCMANRFKG